LDIDGTILDSNNQLDNQLIETLRQLKQKGVKVVLATGGSLDASINYGNVLECSDYVVYNGGYVIYNNKLIYEAKIPAKLAYYLCRKTEEVGGTYIHFYDRVSKSNHPQINMDHLKPIATLSKLADTDKEAHRLALYIVNKENREILLNSIQNQYVFEEGNRIEVYAACSKWVEILG